MPPGLVLSVPPANVRRSAAVAASDPYTCDRSRYAVTSVTCCRGLPGALPVAGSYRDRVNGRSPGPIGSVAATGIGKEDPPSGVRLMSWSMNCPNA